MIRRKYLPLIALLAIAVTLGIYTVSNRVVTNYDRIYPMTDLTERMQTHCVGRLLIDLPEGTTWTPRSSSAQLGDDLTLSVTTGISQVEFEALVNARWIEIQELKRRSPRYLDHPASKALPIENSAVFSYGFRNSIGQDLDGVLREKTSHDAEGYLWRDGTLFKLGPILNGTEEISDWLPRLHARNNEEIPSAAGLCLNGAFVESFYDLDGAPETVMWGFDLPKNLGLVVQHTKVWSPMQPMLERYRESESEYAGLLAQELAKPGVVAERKEYIAGIRDIGALRGDEYVVGATGGNIAQALTTEVGGEWNFPGSVSPSPLPSINVDLGFTFQTAIKPATLASFPANGEAPGYASEAEFFEVWNAILESIRYRPGALNSSPPGSKHSANHPASSMLPTPNGTAPQKDDYALEEFLASLKPKDNWMDDL